MRKVKFKFFSPKSRYIWNRNSDIDDNNADDADNSLSDGSEHGHLIY